MAGRIGFAQCEPVKSKLTRGVHHIFVDQGLRVLSPHLPVKLAAPSSGRSFLQIRPNERVFALFSMSIF